MKLEPTFFNDYTQTYALFRKIHFALFLILPYLGNAQDLFEYSKTSLSLSFFVDETKYPGKSLTVRNDISLAQFNNPKFRAFYNNVNTNTTENIISYPVAYVSGSSPKVQAVLRFDDCIGSVCGMSPVLYIKGEGTDDAVGFNFPPKSVIFNSIPQNAFVYEAECTKVFTPDMVDYFENFSIDWFVSLNGVDWVLVKKSTNRLYVVKDKPNAEYSKGSPFYMESVFYNGCKYAKGSITSTSIVNKILAHFAKKDVKRADQAKLSYYKEWNTLVTQSAQLLQTKDGQCGSWATFFIDCLRIHGLKQEKGTVNAGTDIGILLTVRVKTENVGMYIKNNPTGLGQDAWKFVGEPDFNNKYTNIWKGPGYCTDNQPIAKIGNNWDYHWKIINNENVSSPGVVFSCPNTSVSQSSDCPKAHFGNHQFVLINNYVFDPSYGVSYGVWDVSISEQLNTLQILNQFSSSSINALYENLGNGNCNGMHLVRTLSNNVIDFRLNMGAY